MWKIHVNCNDKKHNNYIFYNDGKNIGTDFLKSIKCPTEIKTIKNITEIYMSDIDIELTYVEALMYSSFDNTNTIVITLKNMLRVEEFFEYKTYLFIENEALEIRLILNKEKFKKYILDTYMTKYLKSK